MIILLLNIILFQNLNAAELSAKEIMDKNEDAKRHTSIEAHARLLTSGGGRAEREKEFTWWRKLGVDGIYFKTLTRFHKPAEVKNEGILFLEGKEDTTEILIYLPAYKKIRRVESGQQSGSFMGSEFSYADISKPHVEDFEYKLLQQEACPTHAAPQKCYVIQYKPNKEAVLERTGSARGVMWVRTDNFMDVQAEIEDLDGKPWKKYVAKEIKETDPVQKKWLAHHLTMENLKTKRSTTFVFSQVKPNSPIADAVFTQQNLSKEK